MFKKILPYLITISVLTSIIVPFTFYAVSPFKGKSNNMTLLWTTERKYFVEDIVDLNGNGNQEIIMNEGYLYRIYNQNGILQWIINLTDREEIVYREFVDLENDGEVELVFTRTNGSRKGIECVDYNGNHKWNFEILIISTDYYFHQPFFEDIDGDNENEILFFFREAKYSTGTAFFVCLEADGNLKWSYEVGSSLSTSDFHSPWFEDFDGDGTKEVVVRYGPVLTSLFPNTGLLEWTTTLENNVNNFDFVQADLDGDNTIETIFYIKCYTSGSYSFLACYDYTFNTSWSQEIGFSTKDLIVADLNQDGEKEIVVSTMKVKDISKNRFFASVIVFDKEGDIQWTHEFNDVYTCISDLHVGNITETKFLNIIFVVDLSVYCLSYLGDVIWSFKKVRVAENSIVGDIDNDDDCEFASYSNGRIFCLDKEGKVFAHYKVPITNYCRYYLLDLDGIGYRELLLETIYEEEEILYCFSVDEININ